MLTFTLRGNFSGGFMQRFIPILALFLLASTGHAQSSGRASKDIRLIIPVSAAERNQVLSEMREFLHGLHNIQIALARKDMKGWRSPPRT
jgi:hypothetical protein